MVTLLGLAPFVVLSMSLASYMKTNSTKKALLPLAGGMAGTLAMVIPVHVSFWPRFFEEGYLGFPHGLELLTAPFTAVLPMGIGFGIGWVLVKVLWRQTD